MLTASPSVAEVKNACSCTSTPHMSVAWRFILVNMCTRGLPRSSAESLHFAHATYFYVPCDSCSRHAFLSALPSPVGLHNGIAILFSVR